MSLVITNGEYIEIHSAQVMGLYGRKDLKNGRTKLAVMVQKIANDHKVDDVTKELLQAHS